MPRPVISIVSSGILALGCSGSPEVESKGGCADATHAGTLLVRADSKATEVVVEVGP